MRTRVCHHRWQTQGRPAPGPPPPSVVLPSSPSLPPSAFPCLLTPSRSLSLSPLPPHSPPSPRLPLPPPQNRSKTACGPCRIGLTTGRMSRPPSGWWWPRGGRTSPSRCVCVWGVASCRGGALRSFFEGLVWSACGLLTPPLLAGGMLQDSGGGLFCATCREQLSVWTKASVEYAERGPEGHRGGVLGLGVDDTPSYQSTHISYIDYIVFRVANTYSSVEPHPTGQR